MHNPVLRGLLLGQDKRPCYSVSHNMRLSGAAVVFIIGLSGSAHAQRREAAPDYPRKSVQVSLRTGASVVLLSSGTSKNPAYGGVLLFAAGSWLLGATVERFRVEWTRGAESRAPTWTWVDPLFGNPVIRNPQVQWPTPMQW